MPDGICYLRVKPRRERNISFETFLLPTVRVSSYGNIECPDSRLVASDYVFREKDGPGARAEHRHACGNPQAKRLEEPVALAEHAYSGAFTSGNNGGIDIVEVFVVAYRRRLYARGCQSVYVSGEIALQRKYAYSHNSIRQEVYNAMLLARG